MDRYFMAAWALPVAVAAPLAWGQAASGDFRPDPQDANASVPLVTYESPFANYRPLSNQKITAWKESIDNVGRIGGWRAYAKEAEAPGPVGEPASGTSSNPAAKPVRGGHDGHKMD